MMPNSFRVEVADNGFVVRYDDPEIVKKNRAADGPYIDEEHMAVFPDVASLKVGLDSVIESVIASAEESAKERADGFDEAFEATSKED